MAPSPAVATTKPAYLSSPNPASGSCDEEPPDLESESESESESDFPLPLLQASHHQGPLAPGPSRGPAIRHCHHCAGAHCPGAPCPPLPDPRSQTGDAPSPPLRDNASRHWAIGDTGATGHFACIRDLSCLDDVRPASPSVTVKLPDGSTATSSHMGLLPFPWLPQPARVCHVFPSFKGSLLSIGMFCDHGMEAHATASTLSVTHQGRTVLTGSRRPGQPLWMFDLDSPQPSGAPSQARPTAPAPPPQPPGTRDADPSMPNGQFAFNAAPTRTIADRVSWLHAAMGSPAESTLISAIRKGYVRMGLTADDLRKHPPRSVATAKGHLDRHRQGLNSTKPSPEGPEDIFPQRACPTRDVLVSTFTSTDRAYMDLTGRFPTTSARGVQQVLVMYAFDANYIMLEPIVGRGATASMC